MYHSTQFFHKPCPESSNSEKSYGQLGFGVPLSGQEDYKAPRTSLSSSQCGFGPSLPECSQELQTSSPNISYAHNSPPAVRCVQVKALRVSMQNFSRCWRCWGALSAARVTTGSRVGTVCVPGMHCVPGLPCLTTAKSSRQRGQLLLWYNREVSIDW